MSIIEKALKGNEPDKKGSSQEGAPSSPMDALVRGEDYLSPDSLAHREEVRESSENEVVVEGLGTSDTGPGDPIATGVSDQIAQADKFTSRRSETTARLRLNLPFDDLLNRGFLSPAVPRSRIAEEFRGIKRPILRNIAGAGANRIEHANLVMVTSALQGDGKTFSSINLALSIAMEQDKTVLFVDADVVRATAGKTLGVPKGSPGLIDLLDEKSELEPSDVIMHTNVEKLRVLPAGNASDTSTEMLASETMHNFMIELSNRYPDRVIVFDSPPLLLTTEAGVLASFMGQIVFVASADITPQHAVQEALEHIGEDKMVGVMLNRASRRRSKLLGIGSYGYGYGYGYADEDKKPEGSGNMDAVPAVKASQ